MPKAQRGQGEGAVVSGGDYDEASRLRARVVWLMAGMSLEQLRRLCDAAERVPVELPARAGDAFDAIEEAAAEAQADGEELSLARFNRALDWWEEEGDHAD